MTAEVGACRRWQEHNGSFQVLKGIHVEGGKAQRGLCYRQGLMLEMRG